MINNPILKGFHPDPSVCRNGGDYYIATSTFEWFPGVRIFHSKDLKNWRLAATPLDSVDMLDMKGNPDSGGIWAPALSYSDGLFWLLFTDVKVIDAPWKNGRNFLVTSSSIEGPWSKPIPMGNGGFDPSLFHSDDGQKYYVYRPWGPRNHSDPYNKIVMQAFDAKTNRLDKKRITIFEGTDLKYTEAPNIYKKDGYYYLLTAEGGTSFEHSVTVARSQDLFGPYELSPHGALVTTWHTPSNEIQKAGHGALVETQNGEWFITYLASRPLRFPDKPLLAKHGRGMCPLGRETAIDRIEWQQGWPIAVGGPHAKLQIPEANLPACDWGISEHFTDNFDNSKLDNNWQTLRIPFTDKLGSLTEKSGVLRLYGNDSLVSLFEQSTIATRWRHHHFSAQTKMTFSPENFQQSAGICCYYNTSNWTYCLIDFDEELGKRCLRLIQIDQQIATFHHYDGNEIIVPDNIAHVWMKVDVEGLDYYYSYSFDGDNWIQFEKNFESWKLSDDYINGRGFFTGAFVGLHCEDISGDGCFADFESFTYQAK